jgi:carboxyl-terminal processing protease
VVLVNRYSASASEIVAACLQDHRRAVVVGERTWGKGSVQNVIELESGRGAIKLTTAVYRRPNGKNIHRFSDAKETDDWGVVPDRGFRIALDNAEMLALIQDRRARDILQPHANKKNDEKTAATTKESSPSSSDRQLQVALRYLTEKLASP